MDFLFDHISTASHHQIMSNIISVQDQNYIFFSDPNLLEKIVNHVCNGGSVIDMAKVANVRYSEIMRWIKFDADRLKAYNQALDDRKEWAKESVLQEIRALGSFDIRKLLNEDGGVKPVSQWPDEVACAVVGIDISEEFDGHGDERVQSGWLKKIKTVDKLKSLEMIAKNLSLLTEKHDHNHSVTLDQLIQATQKPKADEIK